MKKKLLMCMLILFSVFTACSKNDEEKVTLQQGIYSSTETSEFIWLKDDGKIDYYIQGRHSCIRCSYVLDDYNLIIKRDDEQAFTLEVIDKETIEMGENQFLFVDESKLDETLKKQENIEQYISMKGKKYFSNTTLNEIYFIDENTLRYYISGASSDTSFEYLFDDNKLIIKGANKGENMIFQILDNDMLKCGDEIFCYKETLEHEAFEFYEDK